METVEHKIPILFRVSRDLNQKIRALAQREDRSLAAQLRHLIKQATGDDNAPPTAGGSALTPA